jgi:general secretion pathway protein N
MRYCWILWVAATWSACGVAAEAQRAHAQPLENIETRADGNSLPASGNPLWDIPLNSLTATQDRPIFLPARRRPTPTLPTPVALPAAPPPPIAVQPEQLPLKLLGTVVGGEKGIAICLNQANNSVIHVITDEAFRGWILRSVNKREAVFEKASQRTVLTLPSPHDSLSAELPSGPTSVPLMLPSPPAAAPTTNPSQPPGGGTWMDGDGQMIAPPPPGSGRPGK